MKGENSPTLYTQRLVLRRFTPADRKALLDIYGDREVNTFLPWFPISTLEEADALFAARYEAAYRQPGGYRYALCRRADDRPIGYLHLEGEGAHDFGYALLRPFWGQGYATEAGRAVLERARADGVPFVTATHDRQNPASGRVMQRLGMAYRYSYREQWQPKDLSVVFRLYQLNFTCPEDWVYRGYWEQYPEHFVEAGV